MYIFCMSNAFPKDANAFPKDANAFPKDANAFPKDKYGMFCESSKTKYDKMSQILIPFLVVLLFFE